MDDNEGWVSAWPHVAVYEHEHHVTFACGCRQGPALTMEGGEECCLVCGRCYRLSVTFTVREPAWVDRSGSLRPITRE